MSVEKRPQLKKGGVADVVAGVAVLIVGGYLFNAFVLNPEPANESPTVPYEAVTACQDYVRKQATHPSTVSFPMGATSTDFGADGGYRVGLGFTGKNSFGLEKRFDALCTFKPASLEIANAGAKEVGS